MIVYMLASAVIRSKPCQVDASFILYFCNLEYDCEFLDDEYDCECESKWRLGERDREFRLLKCGSLVVRPFFST